MKWRRRAVFPEGRRYAARHLSLLRTTLILKPAFLRNSRTSCTARAPAASRPNLHAENTVLLPIPRSQRFEAAETRSGIRGHKRVHLWTCKARRSLVSRGSTAPECWSLAARTRKSSQSIPPLATESTFVLRVRWHQMKPWLSGLSGGSGRPKPRCLSRKPEIKLLKRASRSVSPIPGPYRRARAPQSTCSGQPTSAVRFQVRPTSELTFG
jgi:hypothetical protein